MKNIKLYLTDQTENEVIKAWQRGCTIQFIVFWTEYYPSVLGECTGHTERSFTVKMDNVSDTKYFRLATGFDIPRRFEPIDFKILIDKMRKTHDCGTFAIQVYEPNETP